MVESKSLLGIEKYRTKPQPRVTRGASDVTPVDLMINGYLTTPQHASAPKHVRQHVLGSCIMHWVFWNLGRPLTYHAMWALAESHVYNCMAGWMLLTIIAQEGQSNMDVIVGLDAKDPFI